MALVAGVRCSFRSKDIGAAAQPAAQPQFANPLVRGAGAAAGAYELIELPLFAALRRLP